MAKTVCHCKERQIMLKVRNFYVFYPPKYNNYIFTMKMADTGLEKGLSLVENVVSDKNIDKLVDLNYSLIDTDRMLAYRIVGNTVTLYELEAPRDNNLYRVESIISYEDDTQVDVRKWDKESEL